ncbi:MAG: hypothetical protein LBD55_10080 [Treponema sp.]|jgi:hypothetical protein|nr:hypothetical protein [Treponema sp.]
MFFINHPFCEFYFGHDFEGGVYELEEELYKKELRKDSEKFTKRAVKPLPLGIRRQKIRKYFLVDGLSYLSSL